MENRSVSVLCPAKINLFLEITGKRDDGYHTIDSVMQKVSLCDLIELSVFEGDEILLECSDKTLPTGDKNLAYKAAAAYLSAAEIKCGVKILIKKRIPVAAGLAGGSTDAAGVLRALDTVFSALSKEKLSEIALSLGADVPFCLLHASALCKGLGEEMSFAMGMPDCHIVIAKHRREAVSTKDAYLMLDSCETENKGSSGILAALSEHNLEKTVAEMRNSFEEVVLPKRSRASAAKAFMLDKGAVGAMMSGSGPSVFGVFSKKEAAEAVRQELWNMGYFAFLCRPWR